MSTLTKHDLPKHTIDIKDAVVYNPMYLFIKKYNYIIDYDVKLSNGLSLQRQLVWTLEQKQNLILSMLKNITLPEFHIALYTPESTELGTTKHKIFKIIDGKQRLSTIEAFINNEFAIRFNNTDYFYKNFDEDCKMHIWNYPLHFKIAYEYEDCKFTDDDLLNWFYLVNFAGTQQDKEHLDKLYNSIIK
jgi:hypothetical protein